MCSISAESSVRMPQTFFVPMTTSLGHLIFASQPVRARMPRQTATAESSVTPVTSFGSNAFTGSLFASVYYMGTAEQWAAISGLSLSGINKTVNSYLGATVYCYSESEPSVTGSFWHYVGGAPTPW